MSKIEIGVLVLCVFLLYQVFWGNYQKSQRCKDLYGQESRLVFMGQGAERACLGPDGTIRYLP